MMLKRISLISCIFVVFGVSIALAQEGVLISTPGGNNNISQKAGSVIKEYVQQSVINALVTNISEVFERTIKSQKIDIFPQVTLSAINKAAYDIYVDTSFKPKIDEIYNMVVDQALDDFERGQPQQIIQNNIRNAVTQKIKPLLSEYGPKMIVEHYFTEALKQHKKVVTMTLAQRQAQLAVIQQQQAEIQKQILAQMQKAIEYEKKREQYLQNMQNNGVLSR